MERYYVKTCRKYTHQPASKFCILLVHGVQQETYGINDMSEKKLDGAREIQSMIYSTIGFLLKPENQLLSITTALGARILQCNYNSTQFCN